MKKLLFLIACAYAISTHAMLVRNMMLTKLSEEFDNNFSGLTFNERKKRIKEAKQMKRIYDLTEKYKIMPTIVINSQTTNYSALAESGMLNFHKNPSAQLEKIIKRLTRQINRSERINQLKEQSQQKKQERRLLFLAQKKKRRNLLKQNYKKDLS